MLGYRERLVSLRWRWIDRVDPTSRAVVDQHANRSNTVAARLAFCLKPTEAVTIAPSVMYQNSRKHDESTWWPAYSNPGAGQFNNASPERYPVPDEYYLPALKIEVDFGSTKLVSNSSYFHRDEVTGYQGSVYDFAYYQSQSWLPLNGTSPACGPAQTPPPCSWYPLIDANGIHLPAGFAGYATPNRMTNQQESWTQEIRWQSNDDASRWKWTAGAFWSLSRELSVEELRDTQIIPFWQTLFGIDPQSWFGSYYNCNGAGTPGQTLPDCDIYYNHNIVHDRQLAGYGELTYAMSDQLKLTLGGRLAKMSFDLAHHGDGLENFGPDYRNGEQRETAFTPKIGVAFQADPQNLFYATYAKGFRPGGGNAPLPPYCNGDGGLNQTGYPNGAPLIYKSDSTQSYEIGSKNNFGGRFRVATSVYYIKWRDIQQNVYVAYNCGLQFTDNLGTAVSKGFDIQTEMVLGAGFSVDASVGYTSARYIADSPRANLAFSGDAISGEGAIDYAPGTSPPWTVALGAQYNFAAVGHDAFVRLDWEYGSRNNWLAAVQDIRSVQYQLNTYTLPSTTFAALRGGVTVGNWSVAAFVDNLFDSHTVTTYALGQMDANVLPPSTAPSVQQNVFTPRPRTFGITATYRL